MRDCRTAEREAVILYYWEDWTWLPSPSDLGRSPAAVAGLLKRGLNGSAANFTSGRIHEFRDDSSDCNRPVNEVIAAYLQAQADGQPPTGPRLARNILELAAELEAFFADHDALKQVAQESPETFSPASGPDPRAQTAPPETHPHYDPTPCVRYFGDYELLEEIARGGMGVVYRARQVSLNRIVALKMILAGQLASQDDVDRFRREAEAAANLDHPNIVPIHEVGEHEGQHYFSMKLIEGGSLAQPARCRSAARRTARAGSRRGPGGPSCPPARHPASRPEARQYPARRRRTSPTSPISGWPSTSRPMSSGTPERGSIVGTPSYMAPEQARSEKVLTTAVDVYSLGAILYELLDRPAAVSSRDTAGHGLAGYWKREPVAPSKINRTDRPRSGDDLPEVPGEGPRKALRLRGSLGGRTGALAARRADRGQAVEYLRACGKWVRRKPLQAALSAVVLGAAAIIVGVVFLPLAASVREERQTTALAAKGQRGRRGHGEDDPICPGDSRGGASPRLRGPLIADRRLEKIEPSSAVGNGSPCAGGRRPTCGS